MAPRLLTVIRGNAILDLLKIEKGFHDGDVWGPFSFAVRPLLFGLSALHEFAVQRFHAVIQEMDELCRDGFGEADPWS